MQTGHAFFLVEFRTFFRSGQPEIWWNFPKFFSRKFPNFFLTLPLSMIFCNNPNVVYDNPNFCDNFCDDPNFEYNILYLWKIYLIL